MTKSCRPPDEREHREACGRVKGNQGRGTRSVKEGEGKRQRKAEWPGEAARQVLGSRVCSYVFF